MKIDFSSFNNVDYFSAISQGDVFSYRGEYCMRTEEVEDENRDTYNAVNVATGELYCLSNYDEVVPVDCKLVINKEN